MNMHPDTGAMLDGARDAVTGAIRDEGPDWRLALKTILILWAFYTLTVIARALLGSDPLTTLQNKAIAFGWGILLTGGIYLLIRILAPGPDMRRKAIVAGLGSLLAAALMAGGMIVSESYQRDSREELRYQAREGFVVVQKGQQIRIERSAADPLVITMPKLSELENRDQLRVAADTAVAWFFFFTAWSAFYLAAVSRRQALASQQRAALAETAAQAAQVRALRYQVNPHFLFNTLNSLSSLVMSDRAAEAETMILKLSDFFRTSLSLDPNADVTLEQEIELQRLYLDIETIRFPRRLKVDIHVPAELRQARLPALVLQPLVENAIKYGVSMTRDRVTLTIAACSPEPGRLEIQVVNRGGTPLKSPRAHSKTGSMGVGIANVRERLQARFGEDSSLRFGPLDEGGYQVVMQLPLIA